MCKNRDFWDIPNGSIPDGSEVEFHYKLRGGQCQSVLTRQFTHDPILTEFPIRDYEDYIIINAIGNDKNIGVIQTIQTKKDSHLETFYDINDVEHSTNMFCKHFACNLPNMEFDYVADFNVGLIELINSDEGRLVTPINPDTSMPIRYPGPSFNMNNRGYLHAYSNESQNRSLLN